MSTAKSRSISTSPRATNAYGPSSRLLTVQRLLEAPGGGVSIPDIVERLRVDRKTVWRYLRALENAGVPITFETRDKVRYWRVASASRRETIRLTTSQMVSLFLSKRVLDFLQGTGFREDLDAIFEHLEASLRRRDFVEGRNLDRKIFDLNEEAILYDGRGEDIGDLVTALLREERALVRYASVGSGGAPFLLDPYTLVIYRNGLYVIGYSHHHNEVRTFALDGMQQIDWRRGDRFDYPVGYTPEARFEGSFGLVAGDVAPTRVRVRFDAAVVRAVRRRRWHASQRFRVLRDGSLEMTMRVRLSFEVTNWLLRWGRHAEVLEPAALRREVADEAAAVVRRYAGFSQ